MCLFYVNIFMLLLFFFITSTSPYWMKDMIIFDSTFSHQVSNVVIFTWNLRWYLLQQSRLSIHETSGLRENVCHIGSPFHEFCNFWFTCCFVVVGFNEIIAVNLIGTISASLISLCYFYLKQYNIILPQVIIGWIVYLSILF